VEQRTKREEGGDRGKTGKEEKVRVRGYEGVSGTW
jgi:hypothetical protein